MRSSLARVGLLLAVTSLTSGCSKANSISVLNGCEFEVEVIAKPDAERARVLLRPGDASGLISLADTTERVEIEISPADDGDPAVRFEFEVASLPRVGGEHLVTIWPADCKELRAGTDSASGRPGSGTISPTGSG